ncbi:glyoxalase III HchA [Actinomyces capricornis]|uniref:Chaperone protein HchA n=1 Tax=Actinomyces capricornis TaxID=2755559 RepID=A0ABN6KAP1_9ACTO|nr:glyoxalase III HchA [Actinomyces capricornis]BDA65381.1 putative chaperone protein HchA [Actinomyces capricornis]
MTASTTPVPDRAEHNAFFPSEYSLSQYVPRTTDFDGAAGAPQAGPGPRSILVIAVDERYLPTRGGRLFSTGNHPVETLVPLMHLQAAGYEIEVATLSGAMAKLEMWAMPQDDAAVKAAYEALLPRLLRPKRLADIVATELGPDSPYAAVFIPGGHGAMGAGIPTSTAVRDTLAWALEEERPIITLCHGPAALCAATDEDGASLFAGYSLCAFPDALDTGANVEIGYLPGQLEWLLCQRLGEQGLTVVNDSMSGQVHRDRLLLTGDSPLAANALGRMAVEALTGQSYA